MLLIAIVARRRSASCAGCKNPDDRRRFHRLQLRLPLVGRLARGFNTARFTRTLSILTGERGAGARGDAHRRRSGDQPAHARRGDGSRRSACAKARPSAGRSAQSKLFPPMTIHLISSGESSGELDNMLERAAIEPGARARWTAGRAGGPAGPAAHRRDGPVRHGHRFCNAPADLRDEQFDSLNLDRFSVLAIA